MSTIGLAQSKENTAPRAENGPAPLVRLRGVTKIFKRGSEKVEVLKHLDLDVPRGDFLALMGPSGSGKTTLLNILGGIDRVSSGEVVVDGESLERMSEGALTRWRARHIGFVFQLYHLLPVLTAEENVALPLILTKLSAAERKRRARAALALVGLEDRARHKPGELSGGQEQRVGIARAIVTDPTILLCDEPTGDLDRKAGDEILHLLHLLDREHGKTIIMVTHDPRAAARAQHTLFMDKGVLSEEPESVQ
ncbi:MAG TPA: ABC transporter ATP-binding protein [Rhizomicrobium sp.]|jgi:putative ABC transport system ATP-binding protein|nr:ABC transporter ATP-binding protein [Rhizomicrobium sp.]